MATSTQAGLLQAGVQDIFSSGTFLTSNGALHYEDSVNVAMRTTINSSSGMTSSPGIITINAATTTEAGVMSSSDKTFLTNIKDIFNPQSLTSAQLVFLKSWFNVNTNINITTVVRLYTNGDAILLRFVTKTINTITRKLTITNSTGEIYYQSPLSSNSHIFELCLTGNVISKTCSDNTQKITISAT